MDTGDLFFIYVMHSSSVQTKPIFIQIQQTRRTWRPRGLKIKRQFCLENLSCLTRYGVMDRGYSGLTKRPRGCDRLFLSRKKMHRNLKNKTVRFKRITENSSKQCFRFTRKKETGPYAWRSFYAYTLSFFNRIFFFSVP